MGKVFWGKSKNSLENTCDVFFTTDLEIVLFFFRKKENVLIIFNYLIFMQIYLQFI